MKVVLFCHSLVSDWNHGNAHFLRGIVRELQRQGHTVDVLEPADGWSRENLIRTAGPGAVESFHRAFPELRSRTYQRAELDLAAALDGADLVIVHDWNEPELVAAIGAQRRCTPAMTLLFYDAHHRALTAPDQIARFDLSDYDAVLAFGDVVRDRYLERGWTRRAYTWHEAADTALFRPHEAERRHDLVWVGNWGDGERSRELREFLIRPAARLHLRGSVYGVRYPFTGRQLVRLAGLRYRDWLPNHAVPEVFARHRVTVHVPRRAYARAITGVPTIRVFEALACGIPLICAPWDDAEGLFAPGEDYLVAHDRAQMTAHLRAVTRDRELATALSAHGLQTIRARHTCAHRVAELEQIVDELRLERVAR